jgi:NADPH2:quinone reductase
MTAEYLLHRTITIKSGDILLIHAAAGGVGQILCQWANALGAKVIGTCGSEEKAAIARDSGCHHVIIYTREDFVTRVLEITSGQGVNVVYDSVGQTTLAGSLSCLRTRGMLVSFGQSSGQAAPLDLTVLGRKSLFLARPSLMAYTETQDELLVSSQRWFTALRFGIVKISAPNRYRLKDAIHAHKDLETRRTSGSSILVPS